LAPAIRSLTLLLGLAVPAGALAIEPAAPPVAPQSLVPRALPMVVRDGRIAEVEVHAVPFGIGSTTLEGPARAAMARLLDRLASDCFLTAQAVGHADPAAETGGDALAAHRLARARADRVAEMLADRGLDPDSIAAVWDWQFRTVAPSVTLWTFALVAGEDCEGGTPAVAAEPPSVAAVPPAPPAGDDVAPHPAAPDVMAAAPAPRDDQPDEPPLLEAPAAPSPIEDATAAAAPVLEEQDGRAPAMAAWHGPERPPAGDLPGLPWTVDAQGQPAARGAADRVASRRAAPPLVPASPVDAPEAVVDGVSAAPRPAAALADHRADPPVPGTALAAQPRPPDAGPALDRDIAGAEAPTVAPSGEAVAAGPVPAAAEPSRLEIVFDVNSSFLPPGAAAELAAFLEAQPAELPLVVDIAASAGGKVKDATPEQARRYNRWMADRRIGRIGEQLARYAPSRVELGETRYLDEDEGRRLIVTVRRLR
jgi:hypothetical protein